MRNRGWRVAGGPGRAGHGALARQPPLAAPALPGPAAVATAAHLTVPFIPTHAPRSNRSVSFRTAPPRCNPVTTRLACCRRGLSGILDDLAKTREWDQGQGTARAVAALRSPVEPRVGAGVSSEQASQASQAGRGSRRAMKEAWSELRSRLHAERRTHLATGSPGLAACLALPWPLRARRPPGATACASLCPRGRVLASRSIDGDGNHAGCWDISPFPSLLPSPPNTRPGFGLVRHAD